MTVQELNLLLQKLEEAAQLMPQPSALRLGPMPHELLTAYSQLAALQMKIAKVRDKLLKTKA